MATTQRAGSNHGTPSNEPGNDWMIMKRSAHVLAVLWGLFFLTSTCHAATRFEAGDGQLAIRTDENPEWKVLNPSDVIPARCRLKTSALGAVWIKCDDRDLYLGANSEANLDAGARQITVTRGQTRLVSRSTVKEDWRCTSGDTLVVCHPGSELTWSQRTSSRNGISWWETLTSSTVGMIPVNKVLQTPRRRGSKNGSSRFDR